MELFKCFKNENLRLALNYRMNRQYKLAKKHLLIAAEGEGDGGEALFFLADAYDHGGFGINQSILKAREAYRKSSNMGCLWATRMVANFTSLLIESNQYCEKIKNSNDIIAKTWKIQRTLTVAEHSKLIETLELTGNVLIYRILAEQEFDLYRHDNTYIPKFVYKGIELGDARIVNFCQCSIETLIDAANQYNYYALRDVIDYYLKHKDGEKAMYYALKEFPAAALTVSIRDKYDDHLIVQYMCGRKWAKMGLDDKTVQFYKETIQSVRKSVLFFMWLMYKKTRWMSKDVAVMIGKMIYGMRSTWVE
jgi:hypothetical protein